MEFYPLIPLSYQDIADSGIRTSGNIVKALAAGASSVMIGSLLAGTDESPGFLITRKGHRYKASRGMASLQANLDRKLRQGDVEITHEEIEDYISEGVEAVVPYRGSTRELLKQLVGGLQSGMSYTNARSIDELHEMAVFVRITPVGPLDLLFPRKVISSSKVIFLILWVRAFYKLRSVQRQILGYVLRIQADKLWIPDSPRFALEGSPPLYFEDFRILKALA